MILKQKVSKMNENDHILEVTLYQYVLFLHCYLLQIQDRVVKIYMSLIKTCNDAEKRPSQ